MALTFVEMYSQNRPLSVAENNQINATRVFKVTNTNNVAAVKDEFDNQPGLKVHPSLPGLAFAGASFGPSESGSCVTVTVNYSTNPGSRFSQPPKDSEKYYHWDFGYKTVSIDVPVLLQFPVTESNGSTSETRNAFTWKDIKVSEKRTLIFLTLRIPRPPDNLYFQLFTFTQGLLDDIHDLDGIKARFISFEQKEVDGTKLDLKYTWEMDKGTIIPPDLVQNQFGPGSIIVPDDVPEPLIRNPFSVIVAIPSQNPYTTPPYSISKYLWKDNTPAANAAWRQLPGMERVT